MQLALDRFHEHRLVFIESGIRPEGFTLPRQHAMEHFIDGIRLFGSPNGICTSIVESKHIRAVKRPYRRSSRFRALWQILITNQRLEKISAARRHFTLHGLSLVPARPRHTINDPPPPTPAPEPDDNDTFAAEDDNDALTTHLKLATTPGAFLPTITTLVAHYSFSLYPLG